MLKKLLPLAKKILSHKKQARSKNQQEELQVKSSVLSPNLLDPIVHKKNVLRFEVISFIAILLVNFSVIFLLLINNLYDQQLTSLKNERDEYLATLYKNNIIEREILKYTSKTDLLKLQSEIYPKISENFGSIVSLTKKRVSLNSARYDRQKKSFHIEVKTNVATNITLLINDLLQLDFVTSISLNEVYLDVADSIYRANFEIEY